MLIKCTKDFSDVGYPNLDINGPNQYGFAIPQSTTRRGGRCSTAKAFLGEARGRSNLHVLVHAFVIKVLFNQYREAIGVVFDRFGVRHKVFARKEIILSAGTINTPQLLMLSGMCFLAGWLTGQIDQFARIQLVSASKAEAINNYPRK